jgi:alpha-mannosidase
LEKSARYTRKYTLSDTRCDRLLALKKAEQGDEIIVRLVELDGKLQLNIKVSFAAPITSAREVNGQEQPVGADKVFGGVLVTSFTAYQPRTFAVRLATPTAKVASVRSVPVSLQYDLAVASNDGAHSSDGVDGKGNALPVEMRPRKSLLVMCSSASRL